MPTYALRTEGFFERREVLDLLVALQVLRDPTDDLALTGFLRGPCVAVRDETLLALARAGPHHSTRRSPRWCAPRRRCSAGRPR
ncbi:MAG: hypothetical protein IPJ95_17810 [Gemmatimonadetes bacterium]|nr:hypothetical protein [Gemmatimonadota bacterium]